MVQVGTKLCSKILINVLQQVLHVITITRASPEEPTATKQDGTKLCSKMLMNILQQVLHTIARTRALPETGHMNSYIQTI